MLAVTLFAASKNTCRAALGKWGPAPLHKCIDWLPDHHAPDHWLLTPLLPEAFLATLQLDEALIATSYHTALF